MPPRKATTLSTFRCAGGYSQGEVLLKEKTIETVDILFDEPETGRKIMAHFEFTQLEWPGIVERTDTELGEQLLRTYTNVYEFVEAVRRVGYNKAHSLDPPGPVRKH